MSKKTSAGGFSLLEVLIAMSLFMVLGASLVALMSRAMDFLESGTAGAEVEDKSRDFLIPFMRDVRNVAVERRLEPGPPSIRFLADRVSYDSEPDGSKDYLAQRLAMVLHTNREAFDKAARAKALGGLEEVVWIAVPTMLVKALEREERAAASGSAPTGDGAGLTEEEVLDPVDNPELGLLTLYRGVKSPVGGADSLFERTAARDVKRLIKVADPLLAGVLHFGVEFEGVRGQWTEYWDSTRSIPPGRYIDFPWFIGPASLEDARDDVSPRSIKVTFVFDRTGTVAEYAKLLRDIGDDSRTIRVDRPSLLAGGDEPFIKVGTEWMQHGGRINADGSFTIAKRGARGTQARAHQAGEPVRIGATIVRTMLIPSYREDWNTQ